MCHIIIRMTAFELEGLRVSVFPSEKEDAPVVYLNTYAEEGESVLSAVRERTLEPFSLVSLSGLDWDHDMSPWESPPVRKDDASFTGGADAFLATLISHIMPEAEGIIGNAISWRGIAGYSLAGLFALYSLYRTDIFSRAASVSGSLWFPGFRDYALTHALKGSPEHIFLSLGSREKDTRNSFMRSVEDDTSAIAAHLSSIGVDTVFRLNPGGHFTDGTGRTADGIAWLIEKNI